MPAIRPPAVAGSFYPDNAAVLAAVIEDFLAEARGPTATAWPKAVIVPHAGYVYSGPVAARAYAALRPAAGRLERVVLVGPAHFVPCRGIAVPDEVTRFETPLGPVPVDLEAIDAIADLPQVSRADAPHAPEHSLEVQLPFLQLVIGETPIVPLAIGQVTGAEVAEVLDRLWGGPETLIVVSSDLSHYNPDAVARELDSATAAAIEGFEAGRLGPEDACGYLGIAGLLLAAKAHGLAIERLDLRTSGQTSGARRSVVGYGAWALRDGVA